MLSFKTELCLSELIWIGNSILRKDKTLNAHNLWQYYARPQISIPSERARSELSYMQGKEVKKTLKLYET